MFFKRMILLLFNLLLITIELFQLWFRLLFAFAHHISSYIVISQPKSVNGKIVLITGAGNGIGRGIALTMASLKAIVVVCDINKDSVEKTAKVIRKSGGTVFTYTIDISDEKKVEQMACDVRQNIGDVYMLINNAGICHCQSLHKLSTQMIRRTIEVNTLSHFWTIKNFLPRMEHHKDGHIIAISSSAGITGCKFFTAYSASKFGIIGLMSSLQEELYASQKDYIKLTTVCPLGISGTGINIPTRTRFPSILPIMTLEYAVDRIVDGILREEPMIIIPPGFKYLYTILRNFPTKVSQIIFEYLDYSIETPVNNND